MPASLDPELLRTFVAFADTGSFTRAARLVDRTQSAVSMQMKRLEEIVGRPLFDREGRQLALSHDGRQLVGYARRMLMLHDEALSRFAEPELSGTVRVGTPDDYAANLLPLVLSRFAEAYPLVHLEVLCETTEKLRAQMDDGALDMAIVTLASDRETGTVLRREPIAWAGSRQHTAHEREPVPLALFLPDCPFRAYALDGLERTGRPYRIAYSSHSQAAIQSAVLAGLAVTAIARSTMTEGMRELTPQEGFPALPLISIALCVAPRARNEAGARLAQHIVDSFHRDAA
jgi:DNA-binding transcriptional LysR family regulator